MENQNETQETETPKVSTYNKYMKKYQQSHPEKMREKCKRYYNKLKEEKPDKHKEKLELQKKRALERYYRIKKEKLEQQNLVQNS